MNRLRSVNVAPDVLAVGISREYGLSKSGEQWAGTKSYAYVLRAYGSGSPSHQIKIALERQRSTPDVSLIRHWMVEIKTWEQTVDQLMRRLKKGRRHD